MTARPSQKPRLVIYGTGTYNSRVVQIADQKGWPIVAAFNRAGAKVGQDLGRVCGLARDIGVIIQDCDEANYEDLDADVAIVAITDRLSQNFVAYQRLMNAGLNVICHGTESYYPFGTDEETAKEIDALAKKNNVTFTGSGIWDMSRIWAGILIAGPCTQIKSLFHRSLTESGRAGQHLMKVVGIGMTQEEYYEKNVRNPGGVGGMYKTILHHVLDALGYSVTGVTERREPVLFDEAVYSRVLEQELAAGLCVGTRFIVEAETAEGVTASSHIELRLFRPGDVEHMMWAVEGKPSARITVERDDSVHMSAASMFNRVRDVIVAPPGIQVVSKLGPLRHTALE
jgi:secondary-alkyl amine dehydrogenase [NAD(P)+]